MRSILNFFKELRSQGYSEGDALMQCVNAARTDLNVPVKSPDDPTTDEGASTSRLDQAVLLYKQGKRGKDFRHALAQIPADITPTFKSQQEVYDTLVRQGMEDGSAELAEACVALGADLPLTIKQ